ncbi:hypothetical protein HanXRQr2_Chr15g0708291 [Helianthus annuus]|uniref:Uncharacterized protein n=1 Tax=Helianthus annuus TaxID=4232 RepID=A0A251SE88_HELAN|nr:uncharacterized protein LOC110912190 [Helianthus annuus]KAF5765834.1 hypothetical protein HanXRQr2_Chr15g0708291 [Helianthus annuus]KAJ0474212.1 hypothetical protein HanHA89_Chr15g0627121 [Helianthus annuus]KAJ0832541.1 hypothetical protein HanPSC8_Chr15g0679911 [Helianthus annuus]
MSSQQIQSHRENAEIFTGEALCKQKSHELLTKFSLPKGLIPLTDVTEVGHNAATGFVWVRRKKKTNHVFRMISRKVSYDCEVTAFVEDRRMRNLTGVKSKELLIWVTVSDICVTEGGKITFGTPAGLSRTFPATAFEEEEEG